MKKKHTSIGKIPNKKSVFDIIEEENDKTRDKNKNKKPHKKAHN